MLEVTKGENTNKLLVTMLNKTPIGERRKNCATLFDTFTDSLVKSLAPSAKG